MDEQYKIAINDDARIFIISLDGIWFLLDPAVDGAAVADAAMNTGEQLRGEEHHLVANIPAVPELVMDLHRIGMTAAMTCWFMPPPGSASRQSPAVMEPVAVAAYLAGLSPEEDERALRWVGVQASQKAKIPQDTWQDLLEVTKERGGIHAILVYLDGRQELAHSIQVCFYATMCAFFDRLGLMED